LAEHCIREMKSVQPEGPYHFAAYSFGGYVALELACQLADQGEKIGLFAVLDSHPPTNQDHLNPVVRAARRSRYRLLRQAVNVVYACRRFTDRVRNGRRPARAANATYRTNDIFETDESAGQMSLTLRRVIEAHRRAIASFEPREFPGELVLFSAREQRMRLRKGRFYSLYKWTDFVRELKTVEVPGRHLEILSEPHVDVLARELERMLKELHNPSRPAN
jgi:thioesterase domain-containing protein